MRNSRFYFYIYAFSSLTEGQNIYRKESNSQDVSAKELYLYINKRLRRDRISPKRHIWKGISYVRVVSLLKNIL